MKIRPLKLFTNLAILVFFIVLNAFSSIYTHAQGTTYYVDQNASSSSFDGRSESTPFKDFQKALDKVSAGDTVLVKNGTYSRANGFGIRSSGEPEKYITLKNYPGQTPHLTTNFWCVLCMDNNSYIKIDGFEITNGSKKGDAIDGAGSGINVINKSHHIVIQNNNIHDIGGAGIGVDNSDYTTIDQNIVHNTSKENDWATSGISIRDSFNFDNHESSSYQHIITNNLVYDNEQTRNSAHCCGGVISDGNGIIMDSNRTYSYSGHTLIANNLSVNNGGKGIAMYLSDNVDVINNTLFKNGKTTSLKGGDLSVNSSDNVNLYNNLIYSRNERPCGSLWNNKNLAFDYNMCYSKIQSPFISTYSIEGEPRFRNPSSVKVTISGFELSAGTKAINNGGLIRVLDLNKLTDLSGKPRVIYNKLDIGALEYKS